nr:fimbrial protein [Burkholderia guangdongensis]
MSARRERGLAARASLGAGVFVLLAIAAQPARALRCVADDGSTRLAEPIGAVASYPTSAPDGYVIWVSPMRRTTGECFKDLGHSLSHPDPVYFYPNPDRLAPAAWGLEVGIRYNGQDYFSDTRVRTPLTVPPCASQEFNDNGGRCRPYRLGIDFQVIVRKKGAWRGALPDSYTAFQFDGERGPNIVNPSFRYSLSGLGRLKPTPCFVDVTVMPTSGIVRFGPVQAVSGGFSPAEPRARFELRLDKKQCNVAVRVDGYFDTVHTVRNDLLLPDADSNFGIGIEEGHGHAVSFNRQFTITELPVDVATRSVPFTAVLRPFGPPKVGPFSATATIRLFLY